MKCCKLNHEIGNILLLDLDPTNDRITMCRSVFF